MKGWCRGSERILQASLWYRVAKSPQGREVVVMHVHSHIGIEGNEKVDALASLARDRHPLIMGRDPGEGGDLVEVHGHVRMPKLIVYVCKDL